MGPMRSVEGIETQHREWLDAVGAVAGVHLDLSTIERVLALATGVRAWKRPSPRTGKGL